MKKTITTIALAIIMLFSTALPAFAAESRTPIVDELIENGFLDPANIMASLNESRGPWGSEGNERDIIPFSDSLLRGMTDREFAEAYFNGIFTLMDFFDYVFWTLHIEDLYNMTMADWVEFAFILLASIRHDHEWEYSETAPHYSDVYGFFVLNRTSCAGDVRAAAMFMTIMGLPHEHVNENQYDHQWLRVNIDGRWAVLDVNADYIGWEIEPYQHPIMQGVFAPGLGQIASSPRWRSEQTAFALITDGNAQIIEQNELQTPAQTGNVLHITFDHIVERRNANSVSNGSIHIITNTREDRSGGNGSYRVNPNARNPQTITRGGIRVTLEAQGETLVVTHNGTAHTLTEGETITLRD